MYLSIFWYIVEHTFSFILIVKHFVVCEIELERGRERIVLGFFRDLYIIAINPMAGYASYFARQPRDFFILCHLCIDDDRRQRSEGLARFCASWRVDREVDCLVHPCHIDVLPAKCCH